MFQPDDRCFLCPCHACKANPDSLGIMPALADKLNNMQKHIDASYGLSSIMIPTSGRRCVAHNKEVNGAPVSQHLVGKAVDIGTGGSAEVAYRVVDAAMVEGLKYIELSPHHVHIDLRSLDEPILVTGPG